MQCQLFQFGIKNENEELFGYSIKTVYNKGTFTINTNKRSVNPHLNILREGDKEVALIILREGTEK